MLLYLRSKQTLHHQQFQQYKTLEAYMSNSKWLQTPYGSGESPNAMFLSPSPFPYGDYHMETVKPNG